VCLFFFFLKKKKKKNYRPDGVNYPSGRISFVIFSREPFFFLFSLNFFFLVSCLPVFKADFNSCTAKV
jgi:hypothetical protein